MCSAKKKSLIGSKPESCQTFKEDTCNIYKEHFSLSGVNKLVKPRKERTMTFIESGGLNGTPESSMTELMEREGWDRLVVEATPGNYGQIGFNRPCVSMIESAASTSWGPIEFFGWVGVVVELRMVS